MRQNAEPEDRGRPGEVVSEIIHEVRDELTAVVAVPGEITYRTMDRFFGFIGEISMLFIRSMQYIFTGAISFGELVNQMALIGVNSLPIVLITVAFSGMVLALYSSQTLVQFGAGGYVGGGVGLSIAREIGPVLTAVVVAARAGSAMAAEIGSMKVTEQIDALRALATSPIQHLVVPRLLATLLMLPVLTILANIVGAVAGFGVAVVNGVASGDYINSTRIWVTPTDVYYGLIKTIFFAITIALVGCHEGLATTGGATGVGRSTTNAVVISIVMIYILNFFLAYILFGGRTLFL